MTSANLKTSLMVATHVVASGSMLKLPRVIFMNGNAKKLDEVDAILGQPNFIYVTKRKLAKVKKEIG